MRVEISEDPEDPKIIEYTRVESDEIKFTCKRVPYKHYDGHNQMTVNANWEEKEEKRRLRAEAEANGTIDTQEFKDMMDKRWKTSEDHIADIKKYVSEQSPADVQKLVDAEREWKKNEIDWLRIV